MLVIGKPVKNSAIACARSRWRNQYVKYKMIPGELPSLRQPQQKTRHIQLMHRVNQAGQHSYSSLAGY